jgi:hypothetical protein
MPSLRPDAKILCAARVASTRGAFHFSPFMSRWSLHVPRSALCFSAAILLFAGCATAPTPQVVLTGDALVDGNAQLAAARPKDRALWEYRVAATALRRDQPEEAKAKLDSALALAAANYGDVNAEAAKSRRLFRRESDKPFVGEPYERAMAHYYRSILYWRDGEPDNARALLRTAQLLDSDTEDKTYAGDYVLFDYLDGYASAKLGGDGSDALARARANAKAQSRATPPDYDTQANVMLFVEYGQAPRKYAGGEHGEQLRFFNDKYRTVSARLQVAGKTILLPAYDDLHYQATTRGGRVMDHVLGNKAVFKQRTEDIGDVALVGAIGTATYGTGKDKDEAALALAAVGVLSKIASAATTPDADTRTWDNLPQSLSFAALRLPPGEHAATLTFLDAQGRPTSQIPQQFTISVPPATPALHGPSRDVVVFRSELPN